ncbi:MAG: cell division protein FtsZ [Prevotellaceae bacterium]|jgi:cell division protein FtsZ|nr:cell division protein FtsZ [Prevotellaceae bacterium]
MEFETMLEPEESTSIIRVVGVGGGGCNAVNYMYRLGIKDVGLVVCNTDAQALNNSPVQAKLQLGKKLTEGLGAGSDPEQGRLAAEEDILDVKAMLKTAKMAFITACMGGGTGTGAAPVIAKAAKDMGVLTVAIVTVPFKCMEPPRRIQAAYDGIRELRKYVDSLIVIDNEKLRELYGSLKYTEAFAKADEVLYTSVKGITEIITTPGYINIDFADVRNAMRNGGVALMGTGRAGGDDRAEVAVEAAISSPLLYNNNIRGARNILVNVMMGENELSLDEVSSITNRVIEESGDPLQVKTGVGKSPELGNDVAVSIIATGFEVDDIDIPDGAGDGGGSGFTPDRRGDPRPARRASAHRSEKKGSAEEVIYIDDLGETSSDGGAFAPATATATAARREAGRQGTLPLWLDDSITLEQKERPAPRFRASAPRREEAEEVSRLVLGRGGSTLEESTPAYINRKPD